MNQNLILDIEKYRNPNETEKEWRLKSKFIEKFHNQFDENRLVCLAQCYVNIETMGCRYSNQLMNLIRELTVDFKIQELSTTVRSESIKRDTTEGQATNLAHESKQQKQTPKKQLNEPAKPTVAQTKSKQSHQQFKQITILSKNNNSNNNNNINNKADNTNTTTTKKPLNQQFQTINQLNNQQQTKYFVASPPKTYNFVSNKPSPKFTPTSKPIAKINSSSTLACPSSTTEQSPAPSLVPIPFGLATPDSFLNSCANRLDFTSEPPSSCSTNGDLTLNTSNKLNPLFVLLNATSTTSNTTESNDTQFQKLTKLTKLRNMLRCDLKISNYVNNKPSLELTKEIIEYFKEICMKNTINLEYVQYVSQDNKFYHGEIYLENLRLIKVQDTRRKRCSLYAHKKALLLLQGPNELAVRIAPAAKRDTNLKLDSLNEIEFEFELYLVDSNNSIENSNDLKFDDDDYDDLNEFDEVEEEATLASNSNNIFHLNTMLKSLLLPNVKEENTNVDDDDDEDEADISLSKKLRIKEVIPNFCIFLTGDAATLVHERNAISILSNSCAKSNYLLEFELKIKGQQLAIKMQPDDSEDESETINDSTGKKKYKCKCLINNFKISSAHGKSKIECKRQAAIRALTHLNKMFPVLQDISYETQSIDYQQEHSMSLPVTMNESTSALKPPQQRYFKISKEDLFKGLVPPTLFETISQSTQSNTLTTDLGKNLLLKMGWKGKGLGKLEQGRLEPLEIEENRLRLGFGHSLYASSYEYGAELEALDNNNYMTKIRKKDFVTNIVNLLKKFISSPTQNDLVFDSALSVEDRKIIHREANRLDLKSKSEGFGETRFMVVKKKRTSSELVEAALKNGGEISSFKLISSLPGLPYN